MVVSLIYVNNNNRYTVTRIKGAHPTVILLGTFQVPTINQKVFLLLSQKKHECKTHPRRSWVDEQRF